MVDPTPSADGEVTADSVAAGWSSVARGVEYRGDDLERDVARARAKQGLLPGADEAIRIGRYVVVNRVGEGGMGVVYGAYDPELDRKVALKLLRPTPGADESARQRRLLREGRALAKLSHPNVVAVYDVGTFSRLGADEVVFIAMEFVEGATLGRWIEQESPPWRARLELMMQAGRGLAAAHAAGLVHRDFKPDNVMVGRDGRVRVMDFGLVYPNATDTSSSPDVARATGPTKIDETITTQGAIVGTPAYMAPEQHLGLPTDARSDQFGFCVTLWETLHGVRPFKGDTPLALAVATTGDAPPLVPGNTQIPGWVRRVIARGLARDPGQRFRTMDELLAALADDPIRARRRWLALAGIGLATSAIFAWNSWQHERAVADCRERAASVGEVWNDDARAAVRTAMLAPGLSYGPATWDRVEPRLDAYAQRWSELRESTCVAALAGPRSADLVARSEECLLDRRDDLASMIDILGHGDGATVRSAVPSVEGLPQLDRCDDLAWLAKRPLQTADPALRQEIVGLRRELARSGAARAAGRAREALEIAQTVAARADEIGWAPLRIASTLRVGETAEASGDPGRAVERYEHAFRLAVQTGDDEEAITAAAQLVFVNANVTSELDQAAVWTEVAEALLARSDPDGGLSTAHVLNSRAALHRARGEFAEGRRALEQALAIREHLLGPEHLFTLQLLGNLATSMYDHGDYPAAASTFERLAAVRTAMLGPEHPDVAKTLGMLASVRGVQGDYASGLELLSSALAIQEGALGPNHSEVALTLHNVGTMNYFAGNHDAAIAAHERELSIRESTQPRDERGIGRALLALGSAHNSHGSGTVAVPILARALAVLESVLGSEHPDVAMCLEELALAHDNRGEFSEALPVRLRVLAIREHALGPDHHDTGVALVDLGSIQAYLGDTDTGLAALRRAVAIYALTMRPEHHNVAVALGRIGRVLHQRGELDEALRLLESSRVLDERALGPDHKAIAGALDRIGRVHRDQGRFADALAIHERAYAITQQRQGPEDPANAEHLLGLADAELGLGRVADAETHARRALVMRREHDPGAVFVAEAELVLAEVLWAAGDRDDARRLAEHACAIEAPPGIMRLRRCRAFPNLKRSR